MSSKIKAYWIKKQAWENNGVDMIVTQRESGLVEEVYRQPYTQWRFRPEFKQANIVPKNSFHVKAALSRTEYDAQQKVAA